ncbi:hypothetical protein RHMOL_Rhmol03G0148500 [Rhododendron molle]|uniref:Uncharacterized protein n=1 Tax=Rhododendron molle TaxID=49168 RepID=A0ACC0PFQ8_RHOML|nr:hypothetical protein RHMOL_Rhmol03G0148500 [Rhododendron molle]
MAKEESSNPKSRWSLTGMTALVTGGTRGIGASSAELRSTYLSKEALSASIRPPSPGERAHCS